jgi:hypothetical protein
MSSGSGSSGAGGSSKAGGGSALTRAAGGTGSPTVVSMREPVLATRCHGRGGEVPQYLAAVDGVVGADAEPETGDQRDRHVRAGHGGQARHALLGSAQGGPVAAHQNFGADVDKHDRAQFQMVSQVAVGGAQRLYTPFLGNA